MMKMHLVSVTMIQLEMMNETLGLDVCRQMLVEEALPPFGRGRSFLMLPTTIPFRTSPPRGRSPLCARLRSGCAHATNISSLSCEMPSARLLAIFFKHNHIAKNCNGMDSLGYIFGNVLAGLRQASNSLAGLGLRLGLVLLDGNLLVTLRPETWSKKLRTVVTLSKPCCLNREKR